jgi:hypothetical protein
MRRIEGLAVLAGFVALCLVCFFRPAFFYFWDEWDNLERLATWPLLGYILLPDCEHFLPVQKVIWATQVLVFGERYWPIVLANCVLIAGVASCWSGFLRDVGVARLPALAWGAFYVTCFANWEVATWGWQVGNALATLATIAAFRIQLGPTVPDGRRVAGAGLLAVLAAWSQGIGLLCAPFLALFALLDWIVPRAGATRRPSLGPVLFYGAVTALLLAVYVGVRPPGSADPVVVAALRGAASPGEAARVVADWVVFALCMGFYGPLAHALQSWAPFDWFYRGAAVGVVLLAACVLVLRKTPWLRVLLALALFQLGVFLSSGLIRMLPDVYAGYSARYQTYALLPVLTAAALVAQAVLSRRPAAVARTLQVVLCLALALGVASHVRDARRWLRGPALQRGTLVREEFGAARRFLTAFAGGTAPDGQFRNGHPHYRYRQLATVMPLLDPTTRGRLPADFAPASYVLQERNTAAWGAIYGAREAVQSFTLDRGGTLFSVDLLVAGRGVRPAPALHLTIRDPDGATLLDRQVPGRELHDNAWVLLLSGPVRLEARRSYRLGVSAPEAGTGEAVAVWMSADPEAYPGGEIVSTDVRGDLTFRIGYVPDA